MAFESGESPALVTSFTWWRRGTCINHMWMAPACERVKFCSGDLVGCGHMSGPFARRIWPLALTKFAERVPIKTTR